MSKRITLYRAVSMTETQYRALMEFVSEHEHKHLKGQRMTGETIRHFSKAVEKLKNSKPF